MDFNVKLKVKIYTTLVALLMLTILAILYLSNQISIAQLVTLLISILPLTLIINKVLTMRFMNWGQKLICSENIDIYERGIYIRNVYGSQVKIFDIFIPWSEVIESRISSDTLILRTRDGSEIYVKITTEDITKITRFLRTSSSCSR